MGHQQSARKKWFVRIVLVLAGLVSLAALTGVVLDQVTLHLCRRNLRSDDPAVRGQGIRHLAHTHEDRAMTELLGVLETEQDRQRLQQVGYATLRTRTDDPNGVAMLRQRADEGPDDIVRAHLIYYAARLSDRDLRLLDWLTTGVKSPEPWRRAGSAAGLLELGQPIGGLRLIDEARRGESAVRTFALEHLRRTAGPVTEAIGKPIAWPGPNGPSADEDFLKNARSIWLQHVSLRVLNDVLERLRHPSRQWYEIGRLQHARDRFARLLGAN